MCHYFHLFQMYLPNHRCLQFHYFRKFLLNQLNPMYHHYHVYHLLQKFLMFQLSLWYPKNPLLQLYQMTHYFLMCHYFH